MKNKLICTRCKLEIDIKNDKWVHIEDWNCNKKTNEIDIHLNCWKDKERQAIQKAFNEKVKEISPMLQNVMGNIGGMLKNGKNNTKINK